jgi:hypothetical protein
MKSFLTADLQFNIAVIGELIAFLYAFPITLAPRKKMEFYGIENFEFKDEVEREHVYSIICQENLAVVTGSIIFWLIAFMDIDREVAIGVATIPWIVLMLFFALNELPQKIGNSTRVVHSNIVIFSFLAYVTVTKTEYSSLAVKLLAGFSLTHGLFLLLSPTAYATFWGNIEGRDIVILARRCAGANVLDLAVFLFALIAGLPPLSCCSLAWGCGFFFTLLLVGECQKFNIETSKIYGWLVVNALLAVTLSLQLPLVLQEEVEIKE